MSKAEKMRKNGNRLRKAADILDKIADNMEDENLKDEEKEENQNKLMEEFIIIMYKLDGGQKLWN